MAEPVEASIEVVDPSGASEAWSFELDPNAPLEPDALKASLVAVFVNEAAAAADFKLSVAGTFGKPEFTLTALKNSFIRNPKPQGRRT